MVCMDRGWLPLAATALAGSAACVCAVYHFKKKASKNRPPSPPPYNCKACFKNPPQKMERRKEGLGKANIYAMKLEGCLYELCGDRRYACVPSDLSRGFGHAQASRTVPDDRLGFVLAASEREGKQLLGHTLRKKDNRRTPAVCGLLDITETVQPCYLPGVTTGFDPQPGSLAAQLAGPCQPNRQNP
eukprot:1158681-Pelagomonas_calceolata.AAC.5